MTQTTSTQNSGATRTVSTIKSVLLAIVAIAVAGLTVFLGLAFLFPTGPEGAAAVISALVGTVVITAMAVLAIRSID